MFKIGKLFHLTHVVKDLDAVDKWYDEIFSVNRFYRGYEKLAVRNASLVAIGEIVMEPVQLANVPGAENSPIGKFQSRFGQHFHSIAWYVDRVPAMLDDLSKHNIRFYDVAGKPVTPPSRTPAIWSHPKDTRALLEFARVGDYSIDPRLQPGWSSAFWRDGHPLGIERASHITAIVGDLAAAKRIYGDMLGGKLLCEDETPGRTKSVFFAVGEDTIVEAAQPLSAGSVEGRELEVNGEGIYAVTFQTRDLNRAADFLKSKKQKFVSERDTLVLNPVDAFGMTIAFTSRRIPNDPR